MTTDITIGELKYNDINNIIEESGVTSWNYNNIMSMDSLFYVKQCPNEDDGCTEEDTMYPGESYRSGSSCGIGNFFKSTNDPEIYDLLNPLHINDTQQTLLKPILDRINKLKIVVNCNNEKNFMNNRRLQWLKFWANKAVDLYDDLAAIQFS